MSLLAANAVRAQVEPESAGDGASVLWTGYTSELLRLREGPSTDYPKLATLRKGRPVEVFREQDGWLYVQAGERLGWVSGEFVTGSSDALASDDSSDGASAAVSASSSTVPAAAVDPGAVWTEERNRLLDRIRDLEVSRGRLESQLEAPATAAGDPRVPELEAELAGLRGAIATAQELRVDLERAESARAGLVSELENAQSESDRLRLRIGELESAAATAPAEDPRVATLVADLDQARSLNADLSTALESSRSELVGLRAEIDSLESAAREPIEDPRVDELANELDSTRSQLERSESEGARLAEELVGARTEVVRLESEIASLESLAESSAELDGDLERLRGEIADLELERSSLRSSLESAESRVGTLASELDALREESARQLAEAGADAATASELAAAQTEIANLEAALQSAQSEVAAARADDSRERLADLEAMETRLRRDLAASEQARAGIWARLENVRKENLNLKNQLAAYAQRAARVVASAPAPAPTPAPVKPYQERPAGSAVATIAASPEPTAPPVVSAPSPVEWGSEIAAPSESQGDETSEPNDEPVEPAEPMAEPASDESTLVEPARPLAPTDGELATATEPLGQKPDSDGVLVAVSAWAEAWSAQDVDRYLSYYAASFLPNSGVDRNAWEDQRRVRVERPDSIEVEIQEITTEFVTDTRAITTFVQDYRSDRYSDTVSKTLEWVHDGSDWKIESEVAVPVG